MFHQLAFLILLMRVGGIFAEILFTHSEPVHFVRNREPAETIIGSFKAADELNPDYPIVYDLYDPDVQLPFQIDRVSGELRTTVKLNRTVGENIDVVVSGTNPFTAESVRTQSIVRIIEPLNRFAPRFLQPNGTILFVPRNASRAYILWRPNKIVDEDEDDMNTDLVFEGVEFQPEGLMNFTSKKNEIVMNVSADDFGERSANVSLTVCNRQDSFPKLCSSAFFMVRLAIPDVGSLTALLDDIDPKKLGVIADALETMADYAKEDMKVAQSMVTVVSAILDVQPEKLEEAITVDTSKKLTHSTVEYSLDAKIPENSEELQVNSQNVNINIYDLDVDNIGDGLSYASSEGLNPMTFNVPSDVLREAGMAHGGHPRVSFLAYKSSLLYKESEAAAAEMEDALVTYNLTNVTIPRPPVIVATVKDANTESLQTPVTYSMKKPARGMKFKCVYWDEKENRWSTEGLTIKVQTGDQISCEAKHMSAFSILFDPTPDAGIHGDHKLALSIISYIGCSLSIFGCLCTLVTYCFFPHLHADRAGKILINLCIAVGMLNTTFVSATLLALLPFQIPCAVTAVSIHFFALASFMWMGIEAFNMYNALVKVFNTTSEKFPMLKRAIFGWGMPTLIAGTACTLEMYFEEERAYGGEGRCKMTPNNLIVYYSTFLAPFGLVLLWNAVVFVMVVVVLCKPRPGQLAKKDDAERKSIRGAQVHGTLAIMFLLGLTWSFGLLAVSHVRVLFQYIFCITNSMQGFFIFIFRCVERKEARLSWMNFCKTGNRRRRPDSFASTSVSAVSSTNTNRRNMQSDSAFSGKNERMANNRRKISEDGPVLKDTGSRKSRVSEKSANETNHNNGAMDSAVLPIDESPMETEQLLEGENKEKDSGEVTFL